MNDQPAVTTAHAEEIARIDGIVRASMKKLGPTKVQWQTLADALREYRDKKLWQFESVKYASFMDACLRKWCLTDYWARELFSANDVLVGLHDKTGFVEATDSENQQVTETGSDLSIKELIALGKAPKGKRREALRLADEHAEKERQMAKRNGTPVRTKPRSKRHIEKAVAELQHKALPKGACNEYPAKPQSNSVYAENHPTSPPKNKRPSAPKPVTKPVTAPAPVPGLKQRILDAVDAEISSNPKL